MILLGEELFTDISDFFEKIFVWSKFFLAKV